MPGAVSAAATEGGEAAQAATGASVAHEAAVRGGAAGAEEAAGAVALILDQRINWQLRLTLQAAEV